MRRKNPFYSLSGMLLTTAFLVVFGWSLWAKGGLAFNPGPLTELNSSGSTLSGFSSHADFESECSRCHQPLSSNQAALCLDCHTEVKEQMSSETNLHGKLITNQTGTPVERCFACHSDHHGRDFSPTKAALNEFNHSITGFSLIHHQVDYSAAPLDCETCHNFADSTQEDINQNCFVCHTLKDHLFMSSHEDQFGPQCTECHDGVDRMVEFDHNQTDFPLIGAHAQINCAFCHTASAEGDRFTSTPNRCADCHQEPEIHAGLFSENCQDCHNPQAWSPALLDGSSFDHANQTGFSLNRHQENYDGSPLICSDCHVSDLGTMNLSTCVDCHRDYDEAFIQGHLSQFGVNCTDCHDGVDRMSDFDHNRFFVLEGKHAQTECWNCHGTPPVAVRYTGTPTACKDCHAEPEIHAGVFGLECQSCHSTDAWSPALLQNHLFPLDHGGQGMVSCQTCHPATYVEYTCYGCHDHDPQQTLSKHREEGISENELANCARCHPTGREEEGEGGEDD